MALTAVSLFSGCGGFDYGATQAGLQIIWANDKDRYTYEAYHSILPNVPLHIQDIRTIRDFPEADVLIGCYPCTGFSIAARRKWKDREERDLLKTEGNFLYMEYLRALSLIKPKYFFVENVLGMASAMEGWFFQQQLDGFRELGYTPKATLLHAIQFGLPQDRKRVFIVGVRNDIVDNLNYTFPTATHGPGLLPYRTLRDAIWDMPRNPIGEYDDECFHGHYLTRNRKRGWDEASFTIVASSAHVPLHPDGDPMVQIGKDKWQLQGDFNRRLSWRECARLQGFPDFINPDGSLKDKYRVIGNAVPPVFAYNLIRPIVEFEARQA
ncbi:MAG: DNA (cytosine-5-)-methyltransferase [Anaerolineaceae bacterium]|nr:DNA (cytosine-5-)-methyltransferase [Anaerolineaceae bacterium]